MRSAASRWIAPTVLALLCGGNSAGAQSPGPAAPVAPTSFSISRLAPDLPGSRAAAIVNGYRATLPPSVGSAIVDCRLAAAAANYDCWPKAMRPVPTLSRPAGPLPVAPIAPAPQAKPAFRLNPLEWSSRDWQDRGQTLATTSFSVHFASNLATERSTQKLLQGVVGSEVAERLAPEAFSLIKSGGWRYGWIAAAVVGGAVYLYEAVKSEPDSAPAAAPVAASPTTFRLVGVVGQSGPGLPRPSP